MTEERDPQRELDALRARLTRAERELVQLRRVAATSEEVALQSKRAMLQSNAELQRTVEQLTATTEHLEEARQTAEEASLTSIHLATSPEVSDVTGRYFNACREERSSPESYDEAVAAKLVEHLFAPRNSVDPAEAYRAFRGRDATIDALMRDRGFADAGKKAKSGKPPKKAKTGKKAKKGKAGKKAG